MAVALSLLLAATFALAGIAKLRDPEPFRATVGTVLPPALVRPIVVLLPVAELLLAALLVAGAGGRVVPAVVLALMLAFVGALALVQRRSADRGQPLVACNCFGSAGDGDPAAARVRNLLLAAAAAALVAWPAEAAWAAPAGQLVGAACVAVGAACAWQLALALQRVRGMGVS